jgi:glycosyltransferase involved in cell wall biosynthesis
MNIGFDAKRAFHNATGLGNYSRDVLRILATQRPDHRYLAYNPTAGEAWKAAVTGVEERRPRTALSRVLPSVWRQVRILEDLRRDAVELFHGLSNELPSGIERTGIRTVVTIHDLIFERFPSAYGRIDRRIYRWKFRGAAERADRVIAISEATRRDLVELYGIPESRIRVVYQGCHPVFSTEPEPAQLEEVRRRYAVPERTVLAVGTIEPRKNLLNAVRAIEGMPGVTLLAVGRRTAYAREVLAHVEAHRLGGRVRILSGVPLRDLHALYRLATVAVYPSRLEGFGIPIVEALVSGTPVVTTRGAPFDEAGGPGSAYVDPDDPEELRAVLQDILGDAARRAAMRRAGLAHAVRFRDDAIATALFDTYREARA